MKLIALHSPAFSQSTHILYGVAESDHTFCEEKHRVSRFCIILPLNFLCHISIQVPTITMTAVSKKRYLGDVSSNTCKRLRNDVKEKTNQVQDCASLQPIEQLNRYLEEQSTKMMRKISHNDSPETDEILKEVSQLVESKIISPYHKDNITHKRTKKNSTVHSKRTSKKDEVPSKRKTRRTKLLKSPPLKSSQSTRASIWRPFQHILDNEQTATSHSAYALHHTSCKPLSSMRYGVHGVGYPTQYHYPVYRFGMQWGNSYVNQ